MMAIVGCGNKEAAKEEKDSSEHAAASFNPEDSGALQIAVSRPGSLNPLFNGNESLTQMYHLVYEGLVTFNENREIEPKLAKEWEWDERGQSITFTLRPNVTWHDGESFKPEDVVFTINAMKNKVSNLDYPFVHADIINQIADARKVSDHQVQVSFSRPFSGGLEALVFPILPQHLFEGAGSSLLASDDFPIIGTGRYQIVEHDTSRAFKLSHYTNYWGESPYIKEIVVSVVPDREAAMSMFESGEIDIVEPLSIDWTKHTDRDEVTGKSFLSNKYEFIGVNFTNEWMNRKELRQAIAYAIDREQILQQLYFNHGIVTDTPVFPHSWLSTSDELTYSFNQETARQMIQDLEMPEETVFTLLTNEDNQLRVATAHVIAEQLNEAGLVVEVEKASWEDLQDRIEERNYDLVLAGWHLSFLQDFSFAFHSTQRDAGNFVQYQNDDMDEILENIFGAANQNQKREEWGRFQRLFIEEMPYISLFYKNHAILHRETLKGDLEPNAFNWFNGIENAYVVKVETED